MRDKYDELLELLEEKHHELQDVRRQHKPSVAKHKYVNSPSMLSIPSDSLASELEFSMRSDNEESERK